MFYLLQLLWALPLWAEFQQPLNTELRGEQWLHWLLFSVWIIISCLFIICSIYCLLSFFRRSDRSQEGLPPIHKEGQVQLLPWNCCLHGLRLKDLSHANLCISSSSLPCPFWGPLQLISNPLGSGAVSHHVALYLPCANSAELGL